VERVNLGSHINVSRVGQGLGTSFVASTIKNWDRKMRLQALRVGIEVGLTFLDTAESYGRGQSELLIGALTKTQKKSVQIATKFSPENSLYTDVLKSAENSLRRLKVDVIDLYQIHWHNPAIPLEETLLAMRHLYDAGKIRSIGVCNFSRWQLESAIAILGKEMLVSNQVEYNLFDRHIEQEVLPFCKANNIKIIAYSPLDKGRIIAGTERVFEVRRVAQQYGLTPGQLGLAWLLRDKDVLVIPATSSEKHIRENADCLRLQISNQDLDLLSSLIVPITYIEPSLINVSEFGEENRTVYRTLDEAIRNPLNLVPSPQDLSIDIQKSDSIKPVRVIPREENDNKYTFDLIERRSRYWAWVIVFGNSKAIPAYIRSTKERE